jgi:hypothetical protein
LATAPQGLYWRQFTKRLSFTGRVDNPNDHFRVSVCIVAKETTTDFLIRNDIQTHRRQIFALLKKWSVSILAAEMTR